jgi:hypothetical protein
VSARITATRTRHGLCLVRREGQGNWQTEDGRYSLAPAPSTTYCESAHPTRRRVDGVLVGGYCEGGAEHDGPVGWRIEGQPDSEWLDTQDEAWVALADLLDPEEA